MSYRTHRLELDRDAEQFSGTDPKQLADMIRQAMTDLSVAYRAERAEYQAGNTQEWRRQLAIVRRAEHRETLIQHRLAVDFGVLYGWALSESTFGLRTLGEGKQHDGGQRFMLNGHHKNPEAGNFHSEFDHPYYYRRNRKAAAIAAHLYEWPHNKAQCEAIAAEFGLRIDVPDFPSWWNPGSTTLVVYVGPAGEVL